MSLLRVAAQLRTPLVNSFSRQALRSLSSTQAPCADEFDHRILAIRREDKTRWERRVALRPQEVAEIVKQGYRVIVQPSSLRCHTDAKFVEAGAELMEDISIAGTHLGVKEIPIHKVLPSRTYVNFPHVHKGQPDNMALLDTVLERNVRLIDHENIVDENDVRLVKFGRFAGIVGMVDTLPILGNRLLAKGYATPFIHSSYAYQYRDLEAVKNGIRFMGEEITDGAMPKELGPMVFVFTGGEGAVCMGSREIFDVMPHEYIPVGDLPALVESKDFDHRKLYGVACGIHETMAPKDGRANWTEEDYFTRPTEFESTFSENVVPYSSVLVNALYWDRKFPRLQTHKEFLKQVAEGRSRLHMLADISCDMYGSLEWFRKSTSIEKPYYMFDPVKDVDHTDILGDGIVILGVDNMPAELPVEASEHFSKNLVSLLPGLLESDGTLPLEEQHLPLPLGKGVIASGGALAPRFKDIIESARAVNEVGKRKVLLLGSGHVAGPVVDYLHRDPTIQLTIGTDLVDQGRALAKNRERIDVQLVNATNDEQIGSMVKEYDLVISLLPPPFHPRIAWHCVQQGTNMVTTSYVTPEMRDLNAAAAASGVILLNEVGVDPGIDHLGAMRVMDKVREEGGKMKRFVSWCGGLPAPEASGNALAYKFSWSPKGVLTAGLNSAQYMRNGSLVKVPGGELFRVARPVEILPGFSVEGYPNRDSTVYGDLYGISDAETVFRGTLRYRGFSRSMDILSMVGMFSDDAVMELNGNMPWKEAVANRVGLSRDASVADVEKAIVQIVQHSTSLDEKTILKPFRGLGLLSNDPIDPRGNYLDVLCEKLENELVYEEGERDMILMHHEFEFENAKGEMEGMTSTLVAYGDDPSAMAKTVGLPCAIASKMVLDGEYTRLGVHQPVTKDIYIPMLERLEQEGIAMDEKRFPL